jgi:hypothetical protein
MRDAQGCDGSIMLQSRSKNGERDAMPMSASLRGFKEVDRIKAKLEDACPLTVSCADIIIMAARDAVHLVTKHTINSPFSYRSAPWIGFLKLKAHVLSL